MPTPCLDKAMHAQGGGYMRTIRIGIDRNVPPPPAQARPRSQKSSQNGGSMPILCLDKAVHARDTRESTARTGLEPYTKCATMHNLLQSQLRGASMSNCSMRWRVGKGFYSTAPDAPDSEQGQAEYLESCRFWLPILWHKAVIHSPYPVSKPRLHCSNALLAE